MSDTTPLYEPGSDLRIAWEPILYKSPKSAMMADTAAGRLTVKRSLPRSTTFYGCINGERVGAWSSIETAMFQTAKIARLRALLAAAGVDADAHKGDDDAE